MDLKWKYNFKPIKLDGGVKVKEFDHTMDPWASEFYLTEVLRSSRGREIERLRTLQERHRRKYPGSWKRYRSWYYFTYEEMERLRTFYGSREFILQHLCQIKEKGYFDFMISQTMCETAVKHLLKLHQFDIEADQVKFVQQNVLNFKYIGYSAFGLKLLVGSDLIYDIGQFSGSSEESSSYRHLLISDDFQYTEVYDYLNSDRV